jgi:hypothetical protein
MWLFEQRHIGLAEVELISKGLTSAMGLTMTVNSTNVIKKYTVDQTDDAKHQIVFTAGGGQAIIDMVGKKKGTEDPWDQPITARTLTGGLPYRAANWTTAVVVLRYSQVSTSQSGEDARAPPRPPHTGPNNDVSEEGPRK